MVDLAKAFDRVQHTGLFEEQVSLGVTGVALKWSCSYLSGRSRQVKVSESVFGNGGL